MRIPSTFRTPGALVALVGLGSVLVLFGILAAQLPVPGGGLPQWSYWWFGASALLWVWGIALAIPRRFRIWAITYAAILTPVVLFGAAVLAGQGSKS